MSSIPVELRVPITELPALVERKSKQTDIDNRPEPLSIPINVDVFSIKKTTLQFVIIELNI